MHASPSLPTTIFNLHIKIVKPLLKKIKAF